MSAANLRGNGTNLGNSITKLSAAARTLANGRGDLFATVRNLQTFTKALADSDSQVRRFNTLLAAVSSDLAGERSDLGAALHNLGIALNQVAQFVRTNAAKTHADISGLKTLTNVLIKEKSSLNETLAVAPAALANLVHSYQPPSARSAPAATWPRSPTRRRSARCSIPRSSRPCRSRSRARSGRSARR